MEVADFARLLHQSHSWKAYWDTFRPLSPLLFGRQIRFCFDSRLLKMSHLSFLLLASEKFYRSKWTSCRGECPCSWSFSENFQECMCENTWCSRPVHVSDSPVTVTSISRCFLTHYFPAHSLTSHARRHTQFKKPLKLVLTLTLVWHSPSTNCFSFPTHSLSSYSQGGGGCGNKLPPAYARW